MSMLFKRIKDWATSITAFRTGDVIPVDGPSGTAKMAKDDLMRVTAENALADNVAPAFDASKDYVVGDVVAYGGKIYRFKSNHSAGAWVSSDVDALDIYDLILRSTIGQKVSDKNQINDLVKELILPPNITATNLDGVRIWYAWYNSDNTKYRTGFQFAEGATRYNFTSEFNTQAEAEAYAKTVFIHTHTTNGTIYAFMNWRALGVGNKLELSSTFSSKCNIPEEMPVCDLYYKDEALNSLIPAEATPENHLVTISDLPEENKNRYDIMLNFSAGVRLVYGETNLYWQNNSKYANFGLIKARKGDVINISVKNGSIYRAGITIANSDATSNVWDGTLWSDAGKHQIEIAADSYISIMIRTTNGSDISSSDLEAIKSDVSVTIDCMEERIYKDFGLLYGTRVKGNISSVTEESGTSFISSGFIKVSAGEKYRFRARIAGLFSKSNVTGLSFYSDSNDNAFLGWGVCNQTECYTTDTNANHDIVVTIPPGVSFVRFSMKYDSPFPIATFALERVGSGKYTGEVKVCFLRSRTSSSGDCTIMKMPDGKVVVCDLQIGDTTTNNAIDEVCSKLDIDHFDYVYITHYHNDHVAGIDHCVNAGFIDGKTIFILPQTPNLTVMQELWSGTYDQYVNVQNKISALSAKTLMPTENWVQFIGGAKFRFWNCDHADYYTMTDPDYNNCSLCAYMDFGREVVLLSGDIARAGMVKYETSSCKCNIYKVAHHAVYDATVNKFYSSILPDVAVTMLGSGVIENQPSAFATRTIGFQQWAEDNFVPNYVTGICGNIDIYMTISPDQFRFDTNCRRCVRSQEGL